MKSNVIKYIFIVFIVGIVIFAVYFLYSQSNKEEKNTENTVEHKTESSIITNLRLGIANFDNINPIVSKNKEILNISTLLFDPLLKISSDYKVEYCLANETLLVIGRIISSSIFILIAYTDPTIMIIIFALFLILFTINSIKLQKIIEEEQ